MAINNIQRISVSLSADVSDFINGLNKAERSAAGMSKELRTQFGKINANTSLLIAQLRGAGKESQITATKMQGLSQKIQLQAAYVKQLDAELSKARTKFKDTSFEVQRLETNLLRAATAEQKMRNELAAMQPPKKGIFGGLFGGADSMSASMTSGMLKANLLATALTTVARAFKEAAKAGLEYSSVLQKNEMALKQLTGSVEITTGLMRDVKQLSDESPFTFPELTNAAKQVLALGFEADNVIPILKSVGDTAAGLGSGTEGLMNILRGLGQIRQKGKIYQEELTQLTENNVAALEILADGFGKTSEEMKAMIKDGTVPLNEALEILVSGMEKKFPDMMKVMRTSWEGSLTKMKESSTRLASAALQPLFDKLSQDIMPAITDNLQKLEKQTTKYITLTTMSLKQFKTAASGINTVLDKLTAEGGAIDKWVSNFKTGLDEVIKKLGSVEIGMKVIGADLATNVTVSKLKIQNAIDWLAWSREIAKGKKASAKVIKQQILDRNELIEKAEAGHQTFIQDALDNIKKYEDAYDELLEKLNKTDENDLSFDFDMGNGDVEDDLKEKTKLTENELEKLVDKVRQAALQFRDALGLFDKATTEKLTGTTLLARLRGQINIMKKYQESLAILRQKFGKDSAIYQAIADMGLSASGQVVGLARSTDAELAQYKSLFGEKTNIAQALGVEQVVRDEANLRKVEQIQINIGTAYGDNIEELANKIVTQLRLEGVV